MKTIYLAAGCFWATEKLFAGLNGVTETVSGYANGKEDIKSPSYEQVCTQMTGFKETVRIIYDEDIVSLRKILLIFFNVIDPTVISRQGADRGTQYQTGIYYTSSDQLDVICEISQIVKDTAPAFMVEIEPFKNFWPAEEYHQNYLDKNPNGYCHIPRAEIKELPLMEEKQLYCRLREKIYW